MRHYLWIVLVIVGAVITGCDSFSNPKTINTIRVLFIGNSLTYFNDLPGMIDAIAESQGNDVIYDSHTPGGTRLIQHASNPVVLQKIEAQQWDFIVLQEQSQFPGFAEEQLTVDVFPYATQLVDAAKDSNGETSVVFYMTMGRRNGDPDNQHVSSELLTYQGMQRRVNQTYLRMAQENNALIAPVGEAWEIVRGQRSDINLYADDIHPNPAGTYLAASIFYATFFQSPSVGSAIPSTVDSQVGQYLQRMADYIVLESGNEWDWRE